MNTIETLVYTNVTLFKEREKVKMEVKTKMDIGFHFLVIEA